MLELLQRGHEDLAYPVSGREVAPSPAGLVVELGDPLRILRQSLLQGPSEEDLAPLLDLLHPSPSSIKVRLFFMRSRAKTHGCETYITITVSKYSKR